MEKFYALIIKFQSHYLLNRNIFILGCLKFSSNKITSTLFNCLSPSMFATPIESSGLLTEVSRTSLVANVILTYY